MEILTHDGPGYRSRLTDRETAVQRAQQLSADPCWAHVRAVESTRARDPRQRYFVICLPADQEKRQALLTRFHQHRLERAEAEGPQYLWLFDGEGECWHLLSASGELYRLDPQEQTCTCRDHGVCRDNGLRCKHLLAFELGLGTFLRPEQWERFQQLAEKLGQPAPERQPVTLPVAA